MCKSKSICFRQHSLFLFLCVSLNVLLTHLCATSPWARVHICTYRYIHEALVFKQPAFLTKKKSGINTIALWIQLKFSFWSSKAVSQGQGFRSVISSFTGNHHWCPIWQMWPCFLWIKEMNADNALPRKILHYREYWEDWHKTQIKTTLRIILW